MVKSSSLSKGYFIAFGATVIWSTTAIFIRYLTVNYQLPPLVLAFWRDLFAALALVGITLLFRPAELRAGIKSLKFLVLYGVVLTLFNASWTVSVLFNGAAVSTVLAYSSGAFTAILGWRLFHERLDIYKLFAVFLSILGCIFVSGANRPEVWLLNPLGVFTGLISGLMMAFYSLMGRWAANRKVSPLTSLPYSFGFAAFFLLVINLTPLSAQIMPGSLFALGSSVSGWLVLLFLAIGPTLGGYGLYTVSLGYLPASVANLIATLEPAFTAALAYFFLNEQLTSIQIFGSVLILSGVLFLRWSDWKFVNRTSQDVIPA
jgi:drug/metabolite transporter (DMT)-like permease